MAKMHRAPQQMRTYFTTFVAKDRYPLFRVAANAELLLTTLQHYREQKKFALHAFVVMPDHLHLLLTPASDVSLEKIVQFVKGGYSFRLKYKGDVWDKGHFDRRIVNGNAYEACQMYIEQNPVVGRLIRIAEEFPYSSAGRPDTVDPRPPWF